MAKKKKNPKPRPQRMKSGTNRHQAAQVQKHIDQDVLFQQIHELQVNMGVMQSQRSEHLQLRDAFLFLLSRLDAHFPNIQKDLAEYFSTNHNLSGRIEINTYNVDGCGNGKESKGSGAVTKCGTDRMKKFSDFMLKHQGETCYIIGAGPSSIKFARSEKVPHFSIGINEAVKTVGCTYGITTDKDAYLKYGDEDVIWFLPEYMNERPGIPSREPTVPEENIVLWKMLSWRDVAKLDQSLEELAVSRELFCYSSSAHPAVHLAYYMGARQLVLVGIDGSLSIDWYAIHKGVTHTLCEMLFPDSHRVYMPPEDREGRNALN
ncbi:MAG: hypothetical protein JRL30_05730 [Deltaproteobacteria bacterium]|nr:hypothetical protein [Deltaproteobacteria bacterium]